jgi:SNF2 family DNA or RNA helicase
MCKRVVPKQWMSLSSSSPSSTSSSAFVPSSSSTTTSAAYQSGKMFMLLQLIQATIAVNEKLVVFAQWQGTLDVVEMMLKEQGLSRF